MVDKITKEARSKLMSKIHSNNTGPEITVRRMLRSSGIGYRLHKPKLPGRPDIIMKGRKAVIFVHGCFWHQHDCRIANVPTSNTAYWVEKFKRNKERDQQNLLELRELGWRVLIVWECSLRKKNIEKAKMEILDWIQSGSSYSQVSGVTKTYLPVVFGSFEEIIKRHKDTKV